MPPAPRWPLWLGYAGLLPFWALALSRVSGIGFGIPPDWVTLALAAYAATILSFLGGIRWGLAIAGPEPRPEALDLALSVIPQLAAWAALGLPDRWRLCALAIMILILGPLDRGLVRRGLAPTWFGRLRMRLSLGAGAALFLAALA